MVRDDDRYVIGVDFGTLSGRAVVVRVADGAELGTAVLEYPHGVIDSALPGSGRRLPPDWALQVPGDYVDVLRTRGARRRSRRPASTRPTSSASAPTSPPARWCRRSPTAPRCASSTEFARPAARLRQAVEAPRRPARRPTASTRSPRERGEPWLARYGGLISSEWEFAKAPAAARGGPRGLRGDGALGRGRRLDRLAAVPAATCATPAPPATRASCQDGALPVARTTSPRSTRPSPTSSTTSSTTRSASSATAPARSPPQAAAWTGLPEGIAVAVGNVDAHVTAPAAAAPSSPARWSPSWAPRPAT